MPPGPVAIIDPKKLKRMLDAGKHLKDIAHAMGVEINTVARRAQKLGLRPIVRRPKFTREEDEFLTLNFTTMSDEEMATELNRPVLSVGQRRHLLRLVHEFKWTPEEEQIVKDNFPLRPIKEWAHLLPHRSPHMIWAKGDRMSLVLPGRYPKEIRELIRLTNRLKRKINEREPQHS